MQAPIVMGATPTVVADAEHGSMSVVDAVKTTDEVPTDAVTVCAASPAPSVHRPVEASPSLPVIADEPSIEPPPDDTVNVTVAPVTRLACESATLTRSGCGSTALAWPCC